MTKNMSAKRSRSNLSKERSLAFPIIGIFEAFLDRKKIKIPNIEREGYLGNAIIYGDDYYELEDAITEFLERNLSREVL